MVDLDPTPPSHRGRGDGVSRLITRGADDVFDQANDVAKRFAIIPAMPVGSYPVLDKLNVMALHSRSAILSAVISMRW